MCFSAQIFKEIYALNLRTREIYLQKLNAILKEDFSSDCSNLAD